MKSIRLLLCLLLVGALLIPSCLAAAEPPEITAPSMVLMEASTGTVLAEKNAHEARPPASVTKIMALLLIFEAMDQNRFTLETPVTVGEAAAGKGGSQIFLEVGEVMPVGDLIKSIVVASANDATCAMAEFMAGSESAFVQLMNQRAAELGMEDTVFVNCTGLEAEGHVTSAYDIALMSRALLQHEEIRSYTTIWMDSVRDGAFGLTNTNRLIRLYNGATGLKTGFTSQAGYCISATAERNGMELICAIMGEATSDDRTATARAMLDYGFANYTLFPVTTEEVLSPIPVTLGVLEEVQPMLAESEPLLLDQADATTLTRTLELPEQLNAPIEEGQTLGTLTLRTDSGMQKQVPIVAGHSVERLSVGDLFVQLLRQGLGC